MLYPWSGTNGRPSVKHRSPVSASIHELNGPTPYLVESVSYRRRPSEVQGIFPLAGAMMRDVRRSPVTTTPPSIQNWLYAPTSPGTNRSDATRRSAEVVSNSAASSTVSTALAPNASGRSTGVKVALVQIPPRSGSPVGVRGTVQVVDWASAVPPRSTTHVVTGMRTRNTRRQRCSIEWLLRAGITRRRRAVRRGFGGQVVSPE